MFSGDVTMESLMPQRARSQSRIAALPYTPPLGSPEPFERLPRYERGDDGWATPGAGRTLAGL